MTTWTPPVVDAMARRRAIVVLGAGSSLHATPEAGSALPPTWKKFLEDAAETVAAKPKAVAKRLIKSGDYLSACDIIKEASGGNWPNLVTAAYGNKRLTAGKLHKAVYDLDLPITMTTNFDRVYQAAAIAYSHGTVRTKTYADKDLALLARGDSSSRTVLKSHGTIDDISSMVFTRKDYAKLRNDHPLFQRVFAALATTHLFLFIGCGLNDPDMLLMLEDMHFHSGEFAEHYVLLDSKQNPEISAMYRRCYNLSSIVYKHDSTHSQLVTAVEDLAAQVNQKRTEFGASLIW